MEMKRIDIIGQNGNTGEHYLELPFKATWKDCSTKRNGGQLSFLEVAELWKKIKPQYEVEDKESWAGKFTENNRK